METLRVCSLLIVCFVGCISAFSTASKRDIEYRDGECGSYTYCQGESFPERFMIKGRFISCEGNVTDATLRENCCLPEENHLVCYGIKVEGQRLNYSNETEDMLMSTDFTDLCDEMVAVQGRKSGRYSRGNIIPGKGQIAFRYGEFKPVIPSDRYIVHLACGVED